MIALAESFPNPKKRRYEMRDFIEIRYRLRKRRSDRDISCNLGDYSPLYLMKANGLRTNAPLVH